jgi:FkbM family methyltransferase
MPDPAGQRLGRMMSDLKNATGHHPVFDRFERTAAFDDDTFHHNFMGAKVRHAFEQRLIEVAPGLGLEATQGVMSSGRSAEHDADPTLPSRSSEDYFEWIDLLEAIDGAREHFVMIEVGAGYGRWIANAAAAVRRRRAGGPLACRFTAVEASSMRFSLIPLNLRDNGVAPEDHRLLHAGVTSDGRPILIPVNQDYGAAIFRHAELDDYLARNGTSQVTVRASEGADVTIERVPSLRLADLIDGPVDLIDMDIQGAELEVLSDAIEALDRHVARLHVATHNPEVERRLCALFALHGWTLGRCFLCHEVNETPYGSFRFIDGLQSWRNPRLAR